ncbi:hypothetical protein EWM64_g6266 [Hericium alpestre]|uniref:Glutaminase A N-terminal domain-containing protein n=1 Tax=Hericium alpestre TaxID=135208 RepID=A0A4Y9ZW63_9AGAM|nr:hypothetical protein EWM64_g6266 [Hericium alpestre]
MPAGPMEFNITWFSPIEPGDWVRQLMSLSYLYIEAASLDGNSHSVQVYSDADGEWLSGDQSLKMQWKTVANSDIMYHQANLINETYFEEIQQQAQWGTVYYGMKINPGVTYKIGLDKDCRDQFVNIGQLDLAVDPDFRPISNPYTVFAIAADLGTISSTQRPVVWAIGLTRDPALSYVDLGGIQQNRSLYYQQNYTDDTSLVAEFLDDFPNARQRADQLDAKILSDARAMSSDYVDLVSYVVRQVYGMIELTASKNPDGSSNTSDVMMFMKNIGGAAENGSTVPIVKLGGPLLEPLLRFQDSATYNPYVVIQGHRIQSRKEAIPRISKALNVCILFFFILQLI